MEQTPFDKRRFEHISGKCEAEYFNYLPRSRSGMRKWEIKARYGDDTSKIVVMRDSGFNITGEVIEVNDFINREERNEEIYRLYHNEGLSQIFLAKVFNMSQPSISLIVNKKCT